MGDVGDYEMMKYYKTGNGYVASVGTVYGAEVTKEEFDAEMDRIQKEQEKEPKPPTLEEQVETLKSENQFLSQCLMEMSEIVYA